MKKFTSKYSDIKDTKFRIFSIFLNQTAFAEEISLENTFFPVTLQYHWAENVCLEKKNSLNIINSQKIWPVFQHIRKMNLTECIKIVTNDYPSKTTPIRDDRRPLYSFSTSGTHHLLAHALYSIFILMYLRMRYFSLHTTLVEKI